MDGFYYVVIPWAVVALGLLLAVAITVVLVALVFWRK